MNDPLRDASTTFKVEGADDVVTRRRKKFFLFWGALLAAILIAFRGVLVPFCLALVVAYVLAPIVDRLQRIRVRHRAMPRWLAVLFVYVSLVSVLGTVVSKLGPPVVDEIGELAATAPRTIEMLRTEWGPRLERRFGRLVGFLAADQTANEPPSAAPPATAPKPVAPSMLDIVPIEGGGYAVKLPPGGIAFERNGERLEVSPAGHGGVSDERERRRPFEAFFRSLTNPTGHRTEVLFAAAQSAIRAVIRGVFTFFVMLMLSAYLLVTKDAILDFLRSLVRRDRLPHFDKLLHRVDRGLAGVVRGQLLICVVNGTLTAIGFWAIGLRYWPVLSLVATVASIIPIFGTILSSIPAIAIGLDQSFQTGLLVLGWITLIHQIEANLLNPKIMGDAAKVNPVLIVFALLAGEHLFGFTGALLGVPVLSILQSFFLHYRELALGVPAPEYARR